MAITPLADEFKPGLAVSKIILFYQADFSEQVHRPINRGQITLAFGQGGENFPVGQRMRVFPQNFQDCPARAGDFARLMTQAAGQRGQTLSFMCM